LHFEKMRYFTLAGATAPVCRVASGHIYVVILG
jgi:hypothetical protein